MKIQISFCVKKIRSEKYRFVLCSKIQIWKIQICFVLKKSDLKNIDQFLDLEKIRFEKQVSF